MSFTFFRKYNKIILAVGGSLLMVIFLIPQAGSMFQGKPTERAYGWIGDQKVTFGQVRGAEAEIQMLTALNPGFARALDNIIQVTEKGEHAIIYALMVEEAKLYGIHASAAETRALIQELKIDPVHQSEVLRKHNASTDHLNQALRHFQMVTRLYTMVFKPRPVSEQELRQVARDSQSQITVKLLSVPANDLVDAEPEPTPAELEELFSKFATPKVGEENPYGLNYTLPNRVKLEYIAVTMAGATEAVKAQVDENALFQRAHKYYQEHPTEFFPDPIDPTAEDLSKELQIDKSALERKPFAEVRGEIEEKLIREDAEALRDKAINAIVYTLNKSKSDWPYGEGGYRQVPEQSQWVSLESLQAQVQADDKLLPVVQRFEDGWLSLREVNDLEGFGASYQQARPTDPKVRVAEYVSTSRELSSAEGVSRLQVGEASNPTTDDAGNKYIFRLIAAEPAQAPTSLDEVRDRVVEDAKRINAYHKLKNAKAAEYLTKAKADGLARLGESLGDDKEVDTIGPFTKYAQQYLPQPFIEGVFDSAAPIIAAGDLDQIDQADRYAAIPVDSMMTLFLVEYTGYQPFTADRLNSQMRSALTAQLSQQDALLARYTGNHPFAYEAIAERIGFITEREKELKEKDAEKAAEIAEAPAE